MKRGGDSRLSFYRRGLKVFNDKFTGSLFFIFFVFLFFCSAALF